MKYELLMCVYAQLIIGVFIFNVQGDLMLGLFDSDDFFFLFFLWKKFMSGKSFGKFEVWFITSVNITSVISDESFFAD